MLKTKLHPAYSFKYIQYGLFLCVFPLIAPVLAWDFATVWVALQQDIIILAFMAVFAIILWQSTELTVHEDALILYEGVFVRRQHIYRRCELSAIALERPLRCRLTGGTKLVLYFKSPAKPSGTNILLSRKQAREIADFLMPCRETPVFFRPAGMELLSFVMLSVDLLAAVAFAGVTVSRLYPIFGEQFSLAALQKLFNAEHILPLFVPAGLSLAVMLGLLLYGIALINTIVRVAGFSVTRCGGVIVSTGGFFSKREHRVLLNEITATEVRFTLPSRLLRRYPIYATAGGYRGNGLPFMICKQNNISDIQRLFPQFTSPFCTFCSARKKSVVQYIWLPVSLLLVSLAAISLARATLSTLVPLLYLPLLFSITFTGISAEGIFKEGIIQTKNRTIVMSCSKYLNRRVVTVYTKDIFMRTVANSVEILAGRSSLYLFTRDKRKYCLRGIQTSTIQQLQLLL